jgi:hypothetical protein
LAEREALIRVQTANLAMRGLLRLYLNRPREGLDDCRAALRLAELTQDLRGACMAHNTLSLLGYFGGDLALALHHAEAGLGLAREIGARRFEADHLCTCGAVHCLSGEAVRGRAELEAAASLIGAEDRAYAGAWVLGFLARFTDDPAVRARAVRDGEAALAAGSISHNHLQFRQNMLEVTLAAQDWEGLEHHARALEAYTAAEPLPWVDVHLRHARLRMAWAQGERHDGVRAQLRALQEEARAIGYVLAFPEM